MKGINNTFRKAAKGCMVLLFLLFSTAPYPSQAQTSADTDEVLVERIAVASFLKGRVGAKTLETLNAPLKELFYYPDNIDLDADRTLTRLVHQALQKRYGDRLVPLSSVMEFEESMVKDEGLDTPRTLAQRIGAALDANVVMGGCVWRYRDRKGGAYAAEATASVGFALYLIHVSSGKLLWNGD